MSWFFQTITSSLGKKVMMAITGFGFIGFLAGHLAGNLTLYGGEDAFNAYAEHLHALGPIIKIAEFGLVIFGLIHVLTGLTLFYQNFSARPGRYQVNKSAGGRTLGSKTMPYTGILILGFVLLHLLQFHFVDKTDTQIFQIVSGTFADPLMILIYMTAMVIVAIHVSHGFWSAFQSLGANHPKYMPMISILGLVLSLVFGIGFGFLPVYVSLFA